MPRRRTVLLASLPALAPARLAAADEPPRLRAPNVVAISPLLVTAGQPRAYELAALGAQGFRAVIYLAPFTVHDSVDDEPDILQRQGIEFVHVPIPFDAPDESHYRAAAQALSRFADRRTLVHCQVNLRASSIVFLYRVLALGEPPARAYEAVARVWSPHGPWLTLLRELLRRHAIDFEPY